MRKALLVLLVVLVSAAFMFAAEFHIGVVTGTVSQSEDDLRGAEALIKKYGDAASGGMIVHLTYPDNFMSEQETVIAQITGLADDPLMKAIIVNQAIPGTVESFRRIRETRPDILLLAGLPHEDPPMLADAAHLSVNADSLARGYLIIYTAKQLGAEKFMHISFPRHMSYELLSKRRDIMRAACEELGLEFIDMGSPDPVSDVGIAGAQQFILEKVPAWLDEYGPKTAFFCTNDAHTEPLLKRVAELGRFISSKPIFLLHSWVILAHLVSPLPKRKLVTGQQFLPRLKRLLWQRVEPEEWEHGPTRLVTRRPQRLQNMPRMSLKANVRLTTSMQSWLHLPNTRQAQLGMEVIMSIPMESSRKIIS